MITPFRRTRIAAAVGGIVMLLGASQAFGAGFFLQESSGSGLGNAYAGGAAAAEDASTIWSNPAGMSRLERNQVVLAVNFVGPSFTLDNGNSQAALNQPLGGTGGNAGSLNVIPDLYLAVPLNKQWAFGVGINAPFGLVTEYGPGWLGRYQALKSDIKSINVNPALSWKIVDGFTVGAGASYQQLKATFTSNANYSAALLQAAQTAQLPPATIGAVAAATPGLDSYVNVDGDDYAWGWNVGVLWDINKNNRIGVSWRSDLTYTVTGNVNFTNPTLPTLPPALAPVVNALAAGVNSQFLYNSGVYADIKLPGIANVSYFGSLNDHWDIMGDVQWTHWSTIQYLTFKRSDGSPLQSTPEFFDDTWRFSVGANYKYNEQWKSRIGVAYDQTPVQDQYRTSRLPDSDRTWLAIGMQYSPNRNLQLDIGASWIWIKNGSINDIGPSNLGQPPSIQQNGLINGTYNSSVAIVGGQITYSF